jgi:hypothetical protein
MCRSRAPDNPSQRTYPKPTRSASRSIGRSFGIALTISAAGTPNPRRGLGPGESAASESTVGSPAPESAPARAPADHGAWRGAPRYGIMNAALRVLFAFWAATQESVYIS